jgi:hypothetical protein
LRVACAVEPATHSIGDDCAWLEREQGDATGTNAASTLRTSYPSALSKRAKPWNRWLIV